MRILYVSTIFPYPAHRGGKLRISNLLSRLSRKHEVHLASLCAEHVEEMDRLKKEVEAHGAGVSIVRHRRKRWRGAVNSVLYDVPHEVGLFRNSAMEKKVSGLVDRLNPDLIWCSRTASLQFLPDNYDGVVLLDQHDLSSRMWNVMAERSSNVGIRWYASRNHRLMKEYETKIYHEVDICVSVSEMEREMTSEFAPNQTELLMAPNGVDVDYFRPSGNIEQEAGALVSVGSMDQTRNVDASVFFVEEVMPLLREQGVGVTYYVVGQKPNQRVQKLGKNPGVIVTGTVDDVRPYLEQAEVVVAPYRMGSGVKHKIPIAFSMGKAVVATPNACHGIDVTHGENVMIAEEPEAIARSVRELLESEDKRKKMGASAQAFIRDRYSWSAIADRLISEVEPFVDPSPVSAE
jgi:sugar transferase (PEP-CTERM/EpsH1 system associated)